MRILKRPNTLVTVSFRRQLQRPNTLVFVSVRRKFLMLCSFLMLLVFAGCSQTPRPSNKIILWHWMTDCNDTFLKLAQQYRQETGVEVTVRLFAPSDSYSQMIIAAAQANVLPDIYGILDKKTITSYFIQAGFVADLTSAMEADQDSWKNSLFDKAQPTLK